MAGQPHARPFEVIDLTSDNEDEIVRVRATPTHNKRNAREDDGSSNHGLPDPKEFKSAQLSSLVNGPVTTSSQPSSALGVLPRDDSLSASGRKSKDRYAPILPGASLHTHQGSLYRHGRDQGQQDSSRAVKNSYAQSAEQRTAASFPSRSLLPGHTPRLTDTRLVQEKVPINFKSTTNLVKGDNNNIDEINATYSLLKPTTEAPRKRRKIDKINNHGYSSPKISKEPTPTSTYKTIITDAIRSGESGMSREVNGLDYRLSRNKTSTSLQQEQMLNAQVIPHVTKAVKQHRGRLPREQLKNIASEITLSSVNHANFRNHLSENGGSLSTAFEQEFERRAQSLVDNAVENAINSKEFNLIKGVDTLMSGILSAVTEQQNYTTPTSAASPDSEEIFEPAHAQQRRRLTNSSFRDESSPATSYSNDRAESHNLSEDAEALDEPPRSERITRGASKEDYYSFKKTRAPRTNKQTKVGISSRDNLEVSKDPSMPITDTSIARRKKAVVRTAIPQLDPPADQQSSSLSSRANIDRMVRLREIYGMDPIMLRKGKESFKTMATNSLEDSMVRYHQWASQSGDSVTITWTGRNTFVAGALTHYDMHNMQYNRHGNLVVGSTTSMNVKMIDGHRTLRPIVTVEESKENSLPAMRAIQDEWRFAPVVSTAYCESNGITFTASFDKTVKIWKVSENGSSMELLGIWEHDAFVNFVVASRHHNMVATASEAHNDAVRVYKFDETDISRSAYDIYNADRATTRPGDLQLSDNWAYHPATMQWGKSESVSKLLLVGYSPRAINSYDETIPDLKKNSGELCCWNVETGDQVHINAGKSQNVFEVIWHPSKPIFLVATAPSGTYDTRKTKTQVRLYQLQGTELESFQCMRTLDCPAADINELTIMPTSTFGGFVTASCTDGRTYIWDTMHEDRLLHVLSHGESIDNPDPELDLEIADSGVKFAAWGQSTSRFYTGSSDGVVKAWDITKSTDKALIRNVLQAPGGIACGVLSSDYTQLIVGDATGHLHLIRAPGDDDDDETHNPLVLPLNRRKLIVPHPDPGSSQNLPQHQIQLGDSETATSDPNTYQICQRYIDEGMLRKFPINVPGFEHRNKVGQGPNYNELGLYRRELHVNGDPIQPLLPSAKINSKWDGNTQVALQPESFQILPPVPPTRKRLQRLDQDLDIDEMLASDASAELKKDLAVSADCALDMEEDGRDYIADA